MMKRTYFIIYFLCFGLLGLNAQQKQILNEVLNWEMEDQLDNNLAEARFDGAAIHPEQHQFPLFLKRIPFNGSGSLSAELFPQKIKNIQKGDTDISALADDFQLSVERVVENGRQYAFISLLPIRSSSSGIELLQSFRIEIEASGMGSGYALKSRTYASESVLASGDFYKISVATNGIHKIDANLLNDLGVDVSAQSINNLRVYGNGGAVLPQEAGLEIFDDLVSNPIEIHDQNNNGQFDGDDYVLFYGEGSNQWQFDEVEQYFTFLKHHYSDLNYYFITFDKGAANEIASEGNTASDFEQDSFDDLAYFEQDKNNFIKGGRKWWGDQINNGAVKDYSFAFPNRVEDAPVILHAEVLGSSDAGQNTFNLSLNGDESNPMVVTVGSVVSGYDKPFGAEKAQYKSMMAAGENVNAQLRFQNNSDGDALGWIDFIAVNVRRALNLSSASLNNGQLIFRDKEAYLAEAGTVKYQISNAASQLQIWDVTNLDAAKKKSLDNDGSFTASADQIRTFVAFDNSNHFSPQAVGKIGNQNLHAESFPDYLMITHPDFLNEANRLAEYHRTENGLEVKVSLVEEIFNEFSSGKQDITAMRDYIKMFYDRANGDPELQPRYLLLFGDASYDFRNILFSAEENTNFVPTYESVESNHRARAFCSDDYFGFLDDGEGLNMNTTAAKALDIGIGRIPVQTAEEARTVIDKIIHYKTSASLGEWLNNLTFVADDEDGNLHLNDAEFHTRYLKQNFPEYNLEKIYLDAYPQQTTAGGSKYPDVNDAISTKVFSGTMMMNYVGHGGENGWAHENILNTNTIQSWRNMDKLPLFVTATCSFSRFDDAERTSAGEWLILNPDGGAIGVFTTVRLVYSNSNRELNYSFLNEAFEKVDGEWPTMGDIFKQSKNNDNVISIGRNNRKFVLLGDPALKLNYPEYQVTTTSINGNSLAGVELSYDSSGNPIYQASLGLDTLKALSKVRIKGEVQDLEGNKLESFNGTINPVIFDKQQIYTTLGQDEDSNSTQFDQQKNILFKGAATVEAGAFEFEFVVPKDIDLDISFGKISYFAAAETMPAQGHDFRLLVGGVSDNPIEDDEGPQIDIYMNDEHFVFGGITNDDPILKVELQDENGINTIGTGIGHDLAAVLDENTTQTYNLNNHYKAAQDDYTSGSIEFPLYDLPVGRHNIRVKAWDVLNNSSEGYTEFVVEESAELALDHVLNYPNPFTDNTAFWFEHNKPFQNLSVKVQIFTIGGKLVKTIIEDIYTEGNRVDDIFWDGLDEFGNKIGRGVYVYQLTVSSENLESATELQKLVILK